ncbi:atlastin-2-like [Haemaphysalis longicornis]
MYTDGACDAISTVGDSARLFALSTMTSSLQVYNLSETITEEDIKHLQFLTDYEILMQQDRSDVPLQELLFLVRDWSEQQNAEYGAEGGRGFLHTRLRILDGQNKELQQLRRFITSCFTTIRCFLMPHPGSKVANTSSFDGPLSDIEGNFKEQLHELVSSLLGPDKLLVKRINGKEISCQELMAYFQAYVKAFKEHKLLESKSTHEATAELKILVAVASSNYTIAMENLCGGDQPYLSPAVLESHHQRQRELAKKWICDRLKMPGEEASQRCLDELTQEIDQAFHKFAMVNKTKMTAVMVRTPTTLFVTLLVFYFMSGTFALIGADSFANFCNLVMCLSSIGLLLWSYVRMSGAMPEVGTLIDNIATILWESALMLSILYKTFMEARSQRTPKSTVTSRGRWARRNRRIKTNVTANAENSHPSVLSCILSFSFRTTLAKE